MPIDIEELKRAALQKKNDVNAERMKKASEHKKDIEATVMSDTTLPTSSIQRRLELATEKDKESLLQQALDRQKDEFIKKYSGKIVRGNGEVVDINGNEWKILLLGELFNFNPEIVSYLKWNQEEIINASNPAMLLIGIEQVKLLRRILNALNRPVKQEAGHQPKDESNLQSL